MRADVRGEQTRPGRQPPGAGAQEYTRLGRQAWQASRAHVSADLARSIALIEMVAQIEKDLAASLRSMAAQDGSEAAARRLRLAEEAIRGAEAAAERSAHLRQVARRWAEHADPVTLHPSLAHADGLARKDGPDLAAQRRHLADEAQAAARSAADRARALQQLAEASAAWARRAAWLGEGGTGQ